LRKYDHVYIKVDVDDNALDVLKGINKAVSSMKKATLLVEDFVDARSVDFLEDNYRFIGKKTVYNSFWETR
jgi:hypothetical protein